MKKLYLAIPYSGQEDYSFRKANYQAGILMDQGYVVYSPISHTHPIANECHLPTDWEYWKNIDESFLSWCDILYVYCLPGWKDSKGVQAEIEIAKRLGKEIIYSDTKQRGE